MKINFIITFILFCNIINCQITKGLTVDFGYNQQIENYQRQQNQLYEAYKFRYKKLKSDYNNKLEMNNYSLNPKNEPVNGYFEVVSTNGFNFLEKRNVYVENGYIKKYISNDNEINIIDGGKVINFRSIIMLEDKTKLEIIFILLLE
jgi:hypothetical protein